MTSDYKNGKSHKGFNYSLTAILLLVLTLITKIILFRNISVTLSMIIGGAILFTIIVTITGTVYLLNGIKEPNTFKKKAGILLNLLLITFFIALIVIGVGF